jgi:hypothetical protein
VRYQASRRRPVIDIKFVTAISKNKSWFIGIQILAILSAKVDKLNINLPDAARQKMTENADKYQVERAQGSNSKYADL